MYSSTNCANLEQRRLRKTSESCEKFCVALAFKEWANITGRRRDISRFCRRHRQFEWLGNFPIFTMKKKNRIWAELNRNSLGTLEKSETLIFMVGKLRNNQRRRQGGHHRQGSLHYTRASRLRYPITSCARARYPLSFYNRRSHRAQANLSSPSTRRSYRGSYRRYRWVSPSAVFPSGMEPVADNVAHCGSQKTSQCTLQP